MKKKYTIIWSVFIIALGSQFFCSALLAQSPEKMSYQAVVRNTSQQLVMNQNVGLQISILLNSPTGTALYVERHTVNTNANGLLSIEIGAGTVQTGSMSGIDWSDGTYYLKAEIDPSGGTSYSISGTSQLLSVPYALHSTLAETVPDNAITMEKINTSGALAGQIMTFSGSSLVWADPLGDITGVEAGDGLTGGATNGLAVLNIGGGTGISLDANSVSLDQTYTDGLYVNEGQVNSISNTMMSGSGASSGQVMTYNGSNVVWTDPSGDITGVEAGVGLTGGALNGDAVLNVGAGTGISLDANSVSLDESYTDGLYVNEGQVNSISNSMLQNQSVTYNKVSGSGASSGQVLTYNGSNVVWSTPAGGSLWSLNGSYAYYNSGYVGIGTNSPSDRLHLYDAANDADLQIQDTYPFVVLHTTSASGNSGIGFQGASTTFDGWISHSAADDAIVISGENTAMANPNLVVDNTGYVGVGTWTPAYPLDVLGDLHSEGVVWVDNGTYALGIESTGTMNLALNGDIVPRGGSVLGYDIGNNVAEEHWDDVCANTFTVFSDARVKNSIENLNAGLNEIMQLRPVSFKYNHNIDIDDRTRMGLIAQEVEAVMPNLVIDEDVDVDPETGEIIRTPAEFKTLNYMDLIPVLVNAIQEQQQLFEEQQQRIEELESIISELKSLRLQTVRQ